MDINKCLPTQVTSVGFAALSSADIRRISVKQIVNPVLFDNLNRPTAGGLYDPHLGPSDRNDICSTCKLTSFACPGHFGHIDLPQPVFHPLFMAHLYTLLRGTCFYCHRFLLSRKKIAKYTAKLVLLDHGLPAEAAKIDQFDAAPASAKGKQKETEDDNEDEPAEEEDAQAYTDRLFEYVNLMVVKHGQGSDRDSYKIGASYDIRKKLVSEFMKALTGRRKCENCQANAHRLRKDGFMRLLEISLTTKQKAGNANKHKPQTAELRQMALKVQRLQAEQERAATGEEDEGKSDSGNELSDQDMDRSSPEPSSEGEGDDLMDLDEDDAEMEPSTSKRASKTSGTKQTERAMFPDECRNRLTILFANEAQIVDLIFCPHGPSASSRLTERNTSSRAEPGMFFMDVVAVPPSRFRPASVMGDMTFESPQNELLAKVLGAVIRVRDMYVAHKEATRKPENADEVQVDATRLYGQLLGALGEMQHTVNSLLDSTKNQTPMRGGKLPPAGVKQILEKKDGLFRKNMMGKRVDYAARSVISPDVNIETNEIGVPPVFAKKLTYPEPVTPHNIHKMQELVRNGTKKHPGAAFIEYEDGRMESLERLEPEERAAKAQLLLTADVRRGIALDRSDVGVPITRTPQTVKKVHRHLADGDIVILNRQPTLHKPSMMCHRVRVLNGEKTIRMHYANCNSYNADFDGDEMNMHFPQTPIAQAEARLIANTDNQYLVPTSGDPLRGLIQDHVVAGVWMTNKETFFTRAEYCQLLYGALRPEDNYSGGGTVQTVPPAILRPKPLWTGKQIVTTILLNITPPESGGLNLRSKSKVPAKRWGPKNEEEGEVHFMDGELLSGILDKSQFGATSFGMVHSVYELYGATIAGKLLGILSRLFTKYLQHRAFTCGMDDLHLTDEGNQWRQELIQSAKSRGLKAALGYVNLEDADPNDPETAQNLKIRLEEVLRDDLKSAGLDRAMMGETSGLTSGIIDKCLPDGLLKPFPANDMQTMTVSGAKGSNVNVSQISCLLGQQALEGRRVPTMVSGKTLPSFQAFETEPRAGGYVSQRFLTGIRPQEYYFHCMAGREGLIDTAVKTSRSGYLQRCLIKHLEGIRVHYDHTVRNSDSSVIQFHYGEDSLDVTKQKHLYKLDFAVKNRQALIQRYKPESATEAVDDQTAVQYQKQVLRQIGEHGMGSKEVQPPVLSQLSPGTHLGSVSETYAIALANYQHDNPDRMLKTSKKYRQNWPAYIKTKSLMSTAQFNSLMQLRYMRSVVDAGEAVGLLASQGVGEPSTQMTLNTFHLAGHGAANVTLGIPRLREIVLTASANPSTPTMKIPFITEVVTEEQQKQFVKDFTRLTISQVVDHVSVDERLTAKTAETSYSRRRIYEIKMHLFSKKEYQEEYSTTPMQILRGLASSFVPKLQDEIRKELKINAKQAKAQADDIGRSHQPVNARAADEGGAEDEDGGAAHRLDEGAEDGDADDEKRALQGAQQHTYEDDSENEDAEDDDLGKTFGNDLSSSEDEDEDEKEEAQTSNADKARIEAMEAIEAEVNETAKLIHDFTFDKTSGSNCTFRLDFDSATAKLLLVGIIEKACRAAVIHQIPGITRCLVTPPDKLDPKTYFTTEGQNLKATWNFGAGKLDLNQIYSNDIAAILRTYGVEAARMALIREISAVFGVYGIGVDRRHLTLIADYMTSEGGYKPFNRSGLGTSNSPFLKASYEMTSTFITEAAVFGDFDSMHNPSSSIVLGKVPLSGTGVFDVHIPIAKR